MKKKMECANSPRGTILGDKWLLNVGDRWRIYVFNRFDGKREKMEREKWMEWKEQFLLWIWPKLFISYFCAFKYSPFFYPTLFAHFCLHLRIVNRPKELINKYLGLGPIQKQSGTRSSIAKRLSKMFQIVSSFPHFLFAHFVAAELAINVFGHQMFLSKEKENINGEDGVELMDGRIGWNWGKGN